MNQQNLGCICCVQLIPSLESISSQALRWILNATEPAQRAQPYLTQITEKIHRPRFNRSVKYAG